MKMPIIEVSDSKQKISSRQISAQRRNLIIVCRFAVKTLIDKAVLASVDDESEELTNFLAILEQILSHRIKPQKSWYGMEEPGSFWLYIQDACKSVPRSCISGIATLDNVKPAIAKGRAWLRCVLMEKRLSEYLTTAIHNTRLTRKYYLDGAIMLSEDVPILFAELLGLNAIDFSFCLKGDDIDLSTPMVVDYSPYLKFEQSQESLLHDEEELRALNMKSSIDSRVNTEMTDEELGYGQKYRLLDQKYRNACEQKGYLEELLRLRENQLDAIQQQNQDMVCTIRQLEKDIQKDRKELEGVIIELQEQLSSMKIKYAHLQESLTYLPDYSTPSSKLDQEKVIPMEDLGSIGSLSLSPAMVKQMDSDQQSLSSLECSLPPVTSTSTITSHHSYSEDTQSMIPLTGSLTSQQSMILFTEPLTPLRNIKILTGSHVSEENGLYTEYISFGPAFTKDIGAIAPMEHEDIDVITSMDHEDIDVITPSDHTDIDVITSFEHADNDVITPSEHAGIDVITPSEIADIYINTPSEHAGIDVITPFEDADIDVIISFEHADDEKQDSVSGPSTPPERPNQSKGLGSELFRDYLLDTDVEQRDKQTDTCKIVSSRDPNFINDNFPPAVEESFFVLYENSEAVGNQYRQPVEHSSQDSGEINPGELSSESSTDQGQITLHSIADRDINDSAEVLTSQMLLSDIFEEMEKSEEGEGLEKSVSDTSTLDDTEFVLLDADA